MDNLMLSDTSLRKSLSAFREEIDCQVPRIEGFALAATDESTRGVLITGIDPESEDRFNELSGLVTKGNYLNPDDQSVLVARGLAGILGVDTGDTLILIGQGYQGATAAGQFPVKGIISIRVPDLNNRTVYMPLESARTFYSTGERLTSLIIMPVNPDRTDELAASIAGVTDPDWYRVLTWKELLKDLLRLMEFDVASNMVVIYILYVVIAFGIFGTILTMMIERTKEFGMLISLGMKRGQLALVCQFESLILNFTGAAAGTLAAFPVVAWYHYYPIRFEGEMADLILQYGFEPVLPFSMNPVIFFTQAWVVFGISLLIGLYPVFKVYRLRTVEASKL